ncbi:TPA: hypothetical protein EYO77_12585, partial [Candidatus Poribacteria bacterium]|nr:hypothetical protein [Candidatus Poribacteria bacterium]
MGWLYNKGLAKLSVFPYNNFFPDGTPMEATGGYNNIHTNGLFSLEYHLRQLRRIHPQSYPESQFPSLVSDPRVHRMIRVPYEIAMLGKTPLHFGDGGSSGAQCPMWEDHDYTPLSEATLARAAEYLEDFRILAIQNSVEERKQRAGGT